MILNHYYHFKKDPAAKSKTRYDLVEYSTSYEALHRLGRKGDVFIYLNRAFNYVKSESKRSPQFTISSKNHISGVFLPDIENPLIGYGDVCEDALLFNLDEKNEAITIYVALGRKTFELQLYDLFVVGELDSEIDELKKRAIKPVVQSGN